jgi:hypothetical protein
MFLPPLIFFLSSLNCDYLSNRRDSTQYSHTRLFTCGGGSSEEIWYSDWMHLFSLTLPLVFPFSQNKGVQTVLVIWRYHHRAGWCNVKANFYTCIRISVGLLPSLSVSGLASPTSIQVTTAFFLNLTMVIYISHSATFITQLTAHRDGELPIPRKRLRKTPRVLQLLRQWCKAGL